MIDLTAAQSRTEPIHHLLVQAYKVAVDKRWKSFVTKNSQLAHPIDATTRANFIHNHLAYEIGKRFNGVDGIEATDKIDFFGLRWLDGTILMRFKYLNHGQPSNVGTEQQQDLADQHFTPQMMLGLAGDSTLEAPTLLTCGYTLDGVELSTVEIRRDCRNHLPWRYEIYGGEAIVEPLVLRGLEDKTRPAVVTSTKKRRTPLRVVISEEE